MATTLYNELAPKFDVFVYSKQQERVGASDGIETFRSVFRHEARLVVVLYRDGWGQTPWTRVESTAIEERLLREGFDFLAFVKLDAKATPPKWLPEMYIWLDFELYGLGGVVGAITYRAQQQGAAPKRETALDHAKRRVSEATLRSDREDRLQREGLAAFGVEVSSCLDFVLNKLDEIKREFPTICATYGRSPSDLTIRGKGTSLLIERYQTNPITDSRLVVREFLSGLVTQVDPPGTEFHPRPREVGATFYYFDYQHTLGWCWHPAARRGAANAQKILPTDDVAEACVKQFLDLEARFDRKELQFTENDW